MSEKISVKYAKEKEWNELRCPVCGTRSWQQSRGTVLIKFPEVEKCIRVNVADDKTLKPVPSINKCASTLGKIVICNSCGLLLLRAGQIKKIKKI